MAKTQSKNQTSLNRYLDKPWLKGTSLYFVEYALFLALITVVTWLFDSLVFSIFGYIANVGYGALQQAAGISVVAATLVAVPAAFLFWRRVRMEERRRPGLWLRKAHRFPLYLFVFLQALSVLLVAYIIMQGFVSAIVTGFDGFGRALLTAVIPGVFALTVHAIATVVFLGKTPRQESSFVTALSASMLISALVLLIVLSINSDRIRINQPDRILEPDRDLFQEELPDDSLRGRSFFEF